MNWILLWWHSWRSRIWFARVHYAKTMHQWHQETSEGYANVLRDSAGQSE